MKRFEQRQIREARAYAATGGQALHVCDTKALGIHQRPDAPLCFRTSKQFAHLMDQDRWRLMATARKLGVRVVFVDREGTESQHVDLCGKPLERALLVAATVDEIQLALKETP